MKKLGILFFGVFLITGCSEKIPQVNDENCKTENISKIKDDLKRATFAEKCFTSGEVVNNPVRNKTY